MNWNDLHRRLGTHKWHKPQPFGPEGAMFFRKNGDGQAIVTLSPAPDAEGDDVPADWLHASISRKSGMPTYGDLVELHKAVWPEGYAYQVFAPPEAHINIHPRALHLWGKANGQIILPDFGKYGSI